MKKIINWILKKFKLVRLRDFEDLKSEKLKQFIELNHEIQKRSAYLATPEASRVIFHYNQQFDKMRPSKLEEVIKFCYADEIKGLNCFYSNKNINSDISCNLPVVFKENNIYTSLEEFIESLKIYYPIESYEVDGAFLNINFPKELIRLRTATI
jgi:hypothetical protein